MRLQEFLSFFWVSRKYQHNFTQINPHPKLEWGPKHTHRGETNWFFAPAEFFAQERTQNAAAQSSAYWLDVDVGQKGYESFDKAREALENFVVDLRLPQPVLVASGHGLQVFFILSSPVDAEAWKETAEALKELTLLFGLKADSTRTADIASLMRLPGTYNHKPKKGLPPVLAEILSGEYEAWAPEKFRDAVNARLDELRADRGVQALTTAQKEAIKKSKQRTLYAQAEQTALATDYAKRAYSADLLFSRCAALEEVRRRKGDVQEPLWYSALQVVRFVQDGRRVAHEISSGHPNYSYEETEERLERLETNNIGPSLCQRIAENGGDAQCRFCPYAKDKRVKTPLALAQLIEQATEEQVTTLSEKVGVKPLIPPSYLLSSSGAIMARAGDADEWVQISEYPIYVGRVYTSLSENGELNETMKVVFGCADSSIVEINVPLSIISDERKLISYLNAAGYVPKSRVAILEVATYLRIAYNYSVETKGKLFGYTKYGWDRRSQKFYLGNRAYDVNGAMTEACDMTGGLGNESSLTESAKGASVLAWKRISELYCHASAPFLLGFLAGVAAPLLQILYGDENEDAILISLYAPISNIGKTTTLRTACGIWGSPSALMLRAQDTENSLFRNAAKMRNLPVCIDEYTLATTEKVENLLYTLSSGKEKARMNKNLQTTTAATWHTNFIVSANEPLTGKIFNSGQRKAALAGRVLELQAAKTIKSEDLHELNQLIRQHYGVFGHNLIPYFFQNKEVLAEITSQAYAKFQKLHRPLPSNNYARYDKFYSICLAALSALRAVVGVDISHAVKTVKEVAETAMPGEIWHMTGKEYERVVSLEDVKQLRRAQDDMIQKAMSGSGDVAWMSDDGRFARKNMRMPDVVVSADSKVVLMESSFASGKGFMPTRLTRYRPVPTSLPDTFLFEPADNGPILYALVRSPLKKGEEYVLPPEYTNTKGSTGETVEGRTNEGV